MIRRALSIAVAAAAFAGAAMAQEQTETRVRYDDLNLQSPAGAQALESRLRHAVDLVCNDGGRELNRQMEARRCQREALDNAHAQVVANAEKTGASTLAFLTLTRR